MKIVLTVEDGTKGADYWSALERAGFRQEEILELHSSDSPPADFGGLLLSGGEDVDPRFYGQEPHEKLKRVNRRRDQQELALIASARRKKVPIFGICRGFQILNVAYGGSLVQDLPSLRPSSVSHEVRSPSDFRAHEVETTPGSFLSPEGARRLAVNSRHHQGIERLGAGLAAIARSSDGLIEAIEAAPAPEGAGPVYAVEWHPENLKDDSDAQGLFARFFQAVRGRTPFPSGVRIR